MRHCLRDFINFHSNAVAHYKDRGALLSDSLDGPMVIVDDAHLGGVAQALKESEETNLLLKDRPAYQGLYN